MSDLANLVIAAGAAIKDKVFHDMVTELAEVKEERDRLKTKLKPLIELVIERKSDGDSIVIGRGLMDHEEPGTLATCLRGNLYRRRGCEIRLSTAACEHPGYDYHLNFRRVLVGIDPEYCLHLRCGDEVCTVDKDSDRDWTPGKWKIGLGELLDAHEPLTLLRDVRNRRVQLEFFGASQHGPGDQIEFLGMVRSSAAVMVAFYERDDD
jgi:hypothetical protein